jgi:pantoate--beta-alanine ligase
MIQCNTIEEYQSWHETHAMGEKKTDAQTPKRDYRKAPQARPSKKKYRSLLSVNEDIFSRMKRRMGCFATVPKAFVPTMGALHDGHTSLITAAKKQCDTVIVSIFVNPTQFGPTEDFDQYPRPLEADLARCKALGVDVVFTPSIEEVYANANIAPSFVPDPTLTDILCGKSRPGFFKGVCNVVERLFNIIQPTHVFFGEKDIQQCVVIEQMVRDLNLNIELVTCPIVRDKNGLAISSRNQYLSKEDYKKALHIHAALRDACVLIKEQQWSAFKVRQYIASRIERNGLKGDYVEVFRPENGLLVKDIIEEGDRICVAAVCGDTRLIDNMGVA